MAVRNARRNPKRTARTASSLMIGVALVAFIAVVRVVGQVVVQQLAGGHLHRDAHRRLRRLRRAAAASAPSSPRRCAATAGVAVVSESPRGAGRSSTAPTRRSVRLHRRRRSVRSSTSATSRATCVARRRRHRRRRRATPPTTTGRSARRSTSRWPPARTRSSSEPPTTTRRSGSVDSFVDIDAFDALPARPARLPDLRRSATTPPSGRLAAGYPSTTVLDKHEFMDASTPSSTRCSASSTPCSASRC